MNNRSRTFFFALTLTIAVSVGAVLWFFGDGNLVLDGGDQLQQARTGDFNDVHPPAMAWIWRWLDRIVPGGSLLISLQSALFAAGVFLIFSHAGATAIPATILTWIVFFFPSLFTLMGTMMKDVLMTGALFLALGLALHAERAIRARRWLWAGATFCAVLALSLRHNAIFAVLPLVLWITRHRKGWRGPALTAGFLAASLIGIRLFEDYVIQVERRFTEQQLFLYDLTAISLAKGEIVMPRHYLDHIGNPSLEELKKGYRRFSNIPLFFEYPAGNPSPLKWTTDRTALDGLAGLWLRTIPEESRAYLKHRLDIFAATLGLIPSWKGFPTCLPFIIGGVSNYLGVEFQWRPQTIWLRRWFDKNSTSLLFKPWVYFLISLLMATFCVLRGRTDGVAALVGSGLVYASAYFVLSINCDFKYTHWTVAATLVGLVCLLLPARPTPISP